MDWHGLAWIGVDWRSVKKDAYRSKVQQSLTRSIGSVRGQATATAAAAARRGAGGHDAVLQRGAGSQGCQLGSLLSRQAAGAVVSMVWEVGVGGGGCGRSAPSAGRAPVEANGG
eukprot:363357-Chlamydomonas_euryale.AAC.21